MKHLMLLLCCVTVFVIAACGNDGEKKVAEEKQEQERVGKQYVCPMKCVAPSASPGKCPKCGMMLEEVNPA